MKEVVLEGDAFWEIILSLKEFKDSPMPLDVWLEDYPELKHEWDDHVVQYMKSNGFTDFNNGIFINVEGNIRKLSEVEAVIHTMTQDEWIKEHIYGAKTVQMTGAMNHMDMKTLKMVRDPRFPSKEEMEKRYL